MTRRLAKKVLSHPFGYPAHMWHRAVAWAGGPRLVLSRAARRADRVLARRWKDDASQWLPGKGPPPSMYGTTKRGPPPKRATAP